MALTRQHVAAIIDIVAQNAECRRRINTSSGSLPASFGLNGQIRNTRNSIKDTFSEDYSQKTQDEMCIGISATVTQTIISALFAKKLPWLLKVQDQRNDPEWFGHYAPKLTLTGGDEYILDWWMTLQIHNPIVWRYEDWRHYPSPFVLGRGVQFASFQGFEGGAGVKGNLSARA